MSIEFSEHTLPKPLAEAVADYRWQRVFIGCSTSQVFRLAGSSGECLYLKIALRTLGRHLQNERLRLDWLQGVVPVPRVLMFIEDETYDHLLLSEVPGISASDDSCKKDPRRVIDQLCAGLDLIHNVSIGNCPFDQSAGSQLEQARQRAAKGLVDESDFDESRLGKTASEVYAELVGCVPAGEELVFTHGDYCLPNVILNNLKLSGFIDLGRAGVADRYQDIALLARSVEANFGREWVEHVYRSCRVTPDPAKIHFYTLLDEFF
jgi:aminoglycoside phosphotransferase